MIFDLCALLFPPHDQREVLLYFLEKRENEIVCYSYLPRDITKAALSECGLLNYLDDIIYGPVPLHMHNTPNATLKSILPRDKWPIFMQLLS